MLISKAMQMLKMLPIIGLTLLSLSACNQGSIASKVQSFEPLFETLSANAKFNLLHAKHKLSTVASQAVTASNFSQWADEANRAFYKGKELGTRQRIAYNDLNPQLKDLYDIYKGDTITPSQVSQRVADYKKAIENDKSLSSLMRSFYISAAEHTHANFLYLADGNITTAAILPQTTVWQRAAAAARGFVVDGIATAAAGAGLGTVVPGIGTTAGAVVGGVGGALTGAWNGWENP